jgi:glutamine amidotransferase
LKEAPRSLAQLSREHRDGWGLAIWDDGEAWRLERGVLCAHEDDQFHRLAVGSRGEALVAHVRQRTVGHTKIENTHPFRNGRWVFAHNGTIKDLAFLRGGVSAARAQEIRGETDSELLFAWVLTRFDEVGVADVAPEAATDRALKDAVRTLRGVAGLGAYNFLLSDGATTYAHRFGRTLHLLERGPTDAVRSSRRSREGVVVETPWSQRRTAVLVASERLTDEPWEELAEGMLLRIDRRPLPRWRLVDAMGP